jgi:hypothetical protein
MLSGSRPALFVAALGVVLLLGRLPTRSRHLAFADRITSRAPA